jgi:DNA primase
MNLNKGLMFVDQLDKVKQTGPNKWMACCPAHDDLTPSLSIAQLDDGRVLIHCFGGCAVEDVVASVGLRLEHLFPDDLQNRPGIAHKRKQWCDKTTDEWALMIAQDKRKRGEKLSKEDLAYEMECFRRQRARA